MYQETEKFKKYGKLFVPLVGAALLLPFFGGRDCECLFGEF